MKRSALAVVASILLLTGCGASTAEVAEPQESTAPAIESMPPPEPAPTQTPTATPTAEPEPEPEPVPEPAPPVAPPPPPSPTREPTVEPTVEPTPQPEEVSYANCTEVREAGAAPIRQGEPGYSSDLDRDGDGIACDVEG